MFTLETNIDGTTGFFREPSTLETVVNRLLPALLPPKRVACIGCSRGQEVYSLAALALREAGKPDFKVDGFDNRPDRISDARGGIYELHGYLEPDDYRDRMIRDSFDASSVNTTEGIKRWVKIPTNVRDLVSYATLDILEEPLPRSYQVVVCANVLYYYGQHPSNLSRILGNIKQSMTPRGYLVCETEVEDRDFDQPGKTEYLKALRSDGDFRDRSDVAIPLPSRAAVFQLVN